MEAENEEVKKDDFIIKKRSILPELHNMSIAIANMTGDAAKLEIQDNEQASLRLKRSLVKFKKNELSAFEEVVKGVRTEITINKTKKTNESKQQQRS